MPDFFRSLEAALQKLKDRPVLQPEQMPREVSSPQAVSLPIPQHIDRIDLPKAA